MGPIFMLVHCLAPAVGSAPGEAAAPLPASTPDAAQVHDSEVESLYEEGRIHYDLGEFDVAIRHFKKAYQLSSDPSYIFNIAQSHRQKGDYQEALYSYRTFLRLAPDAANRRDVDALIAEMETSLEAAPDPIAPREESVERRVEPASMAEPPPPSSLPAQSHREEPASATPPLDAAPSAPAVSDLPILGIVVSCTGIGLLAVGGLLHVTAFSASQEITQLSDRGGTWTPRYKDVYDIGSAANIGAVTTDVLGGVTLLGGVILVLVDATSDGAGGAGESFPSAGSRSPPVTAITLSAPQVNVIR